MVRSPGRVVFLLLFSGLQSAEQKFPAGLGLGLGLG